MARRRGPPPAPPRRSGGLGGALFWPFAFVTAIVVFGAVFFLSAVERPGPTQEARTFVVDNGASGAQIGEKLEHEQFITDALLFRIANRLFAHGESLQAGEYSVPAGASVRDIVRMMTSGDALLHGITFHEGITIAAVMKIIAENDVLIGDMPDAPPEGSILPETYHVQRGMTRAALLQQMRDARDEAVAEIWERRQPGLPLATPDDLVKLASIVERETGVAEERPLVAAVFINRLRVPMRLETDPTIIYGVCLRFPDRCDDGRLVDAQGRRRTIRQSEIEMNTGYNTYRIDGLPPTPIANPGRAALEAAANPAASNAIYFVADGSGGHAFAATLAEHNANVARWRTIERERLAEQRAN
jgi:UPF0755 protein